MTKAPIDLQDLRRRIYAKAKAEPSWRFWGLYVHVCKMETLQAAYKLAKENNGAPGVDGVTFEAVESAGRAEFLEQLREELVSGTYMPERVRRVGIPKTGGNLRMLSIPTIRDRVVQGALKLILEPIFESDFQPGSFGYRIVRRLLWTVPKRSRLEVRLEDGFQDELQRTLDHSVANRRNGKLADFSAGLRYSYAPHPLGKIRTGHKLLAQLLEELRAPRTLHGSERHPINSRSAVVLLGELVRSLQRLHLADVHVQSPEAP